MPLVPETVNFVLARVGIDYRVPDDMSTEELRKIMSNFKSESGGGLETGLPGSNGEGTGASGDPNTANQGS
jgi:3-dehydroquinate synthetase